jgi:hypothetical protein
MAKVWVLTSGGYEAQIIAVFAKKKEAAASRHGDEEIEEHELYDGVGTKLRYYWEARRNGVEKIVVMPYQTMPDLPHVEVNGRHYIAQAATLPELRKMMGVVD